MKSTPPSDLHSRPRPKHLPDAGAATSPSILHACGVRASGQRPPRRAWAMNEEELMSQPAVNRPHPSDPETASKAPPLHLVEPGVPEQADHEQQRAAFWQRCEDIARRLAVSTLRERLAMYRAGEFTYRELSTATALRPDLIPILNGEWEWITVNAE